MYTLTIDHPHTSAVTTHPSREVAYAELVTFLEATHQTLRVVAASWTRASYDIIGHADHVVGRAAIDEICICTHTARDHEEMGCTAISLQPGPLAECGCTGHRPQCVEVALFTPEAPT